MRISQLLLVSGKVDISCSIQYIGLDDNSRQLPVATTILQTQQLAGIMSEGGLDKVSAGFSSDE